MTESLAFTDSIVVDAVAETVYDVVSDVRRTGEWSPICEACWWADGEEPDVDGPRVDSWFHGRNVTADRTWETRSRVAVADRGREFAWMVNASLVSWSYTMSPEGTGTRLTETWEFLPAGIEYFQQKFGPQAQQQIDDRHRAAVAEIPVTLARIKQIIEAG
ncbi:SRPBCC family protein [Nakamurella sp. A5-74]|uniref:SRPBCC family protein n=1 Tax=Nakamurella sp. A5-74 TaxID=3158264 RepID=A0AAU8DPB0_9ACTN